MLEKYFDRKYLDITSQKFFQPLFPRSIYLDRIKTNLTILVIFDVILFLERVKFLVVGKSGDGFRFSNKRFPPETIIKGNVTNSFMTLNQQW